MSTLTKIFIVLMVVFSIAFTMTTINFVAKANDWKKLAEDYRGEQLLIETSMRNQAAAHVADQTAWLDTKNSLQDQLGRCQTTEADNLAKLAANGEELARLRGEKGDAEALASRLASQLQIAQKGWLEQRAERENLENRNIELERRNLDLNERVNEQTAQILVLVEQQKQLEQQVNILREESRKLAHGGRLAVDREAVASAGVGGVTPVAAPSATPIRGKVVEIQGSIATISVGTADGVQSGMTFVIYRGADYIADLKITDVEPNLAAGRLLAMRATPRAGDTVTDEPALGSAQ